MEMAKGTLFIFHTEIITELTFPSRVTALWTLFIAMNLACRTLGSADE